MNLPLETRSKLSAAVIRQQVQRKASLKVRYSDLEKGSDLSSNHLLNAGDVIVVP